MVAKKSESEVKRASFRPDEMSQGGLPDDIDVTITEAFLAPWDYNGKREEYTLAAFLHMVPDPGQEWEDPFWQPYSCGNLNDFLPSKDGEEPIDFENWEQVPVNAMELDLDAIEPVMGTYAVPVGKRSQLSSSSNWAKFIGSAIESGFDIDSITDEVTFIVGTHGHVKRLDPTGGKGRSGIIRKEGEEESKSDGKILMLTDITEPPKGVKAASGASSKAKTTVSKKAVKEEEDEEEVATKVKATKKSAPASDDDINAELEAALVTAVAENEGTLPKAKLPGVVVRAFKGNATASKAALKLVNDQEFLGSMDSLVYDPENGTLELA